MISDNHIPYKHERREVSLYDRGCRHVWQGIGVRKCDCWLAALEDPNNEERDNALHPT